MTQDEIIEMAKKLGITVELASHPAVKQLINEVVKQTEDRFMQLFLDPENQPTQFGTATEQYREQEINDETEMCAEVVLDELKKYGELDFQHVRYVLNSVYFKIKSRGTH